jgi:hypothetical protein
VHIYIEERNSGYSFTITSQEEKTPVRSHGWHDCRRDKHGNARGTVIHPASKIFTLHISSGADITSQLFLIRDPIAFELHRRGLAQLVELRGGIDELRGALKIMASKVVSNEEFAQVPAVRADGTNPRVQEIVDTTASEVHGAAAETNLKSPSQEMPVEPAPLTYNKVLDILGPTK